MEANKDQTNANTNTTNSGTANGQSGSDNKMQDMMEMVTAGIGMLQMQAGRVPEMLSTAGTAVVNGVKNMSTTRKVIAGSVLAAGAFLLVRNMRSKQNNKGSNGSSNRKNKKS